MKFAKLACALLAVSCMVPVFAGCKGGCCGRSCKKVAIAKKAANKACKTKACKSCKGGYCRRIK